MTLIDKNPRWRPKLEIFYSKYHHFLTNIHGKLIRNLQIDFHWKEFNKNYFKPFNIVQMVQLPHIQQNAKFKLSHKTMPVSRQQA